MRTISDSDYILAVRLLRALSREAGDTGARAADNRRKARLLSGKLERRMECGKGRG